MCIKHRCIVTKTRRSKYCHKHLQQLKLPNQLHKNIGQHSKIVPAMIQQNCIADALCHQAVSLFCRICLSSAMAGPNRYKVHGCTTQSDYNRTTGTHMQLSLYTLILGVWFGLAVYLHRCLQTQYCTHCTATISKGDIACIEVQPSHIRKMARQHSYKVHSLSVCSFLDSALQGPS